MDTGRPSWSTKWAKAWRAFVVEAAADLGAPWVLCGKGGKSFVAVTPVGWWLSSVGYDPTRSGAGYLQAGHVALTEPLRSLKSFRQDEYRGDDKPRPGFEPWAEDAGYVFRWWATGPAQACFSEHTEREWVDIREKTFDLARDRPAPKWPMLAGFRVLYNNGAAEPVIDAYLQYIDDNGYMDEERPWWEEFRTMVTSKSRVEVLRWLDAQRRTGLAAAGVPDSAIADVLAELV